MTKLDQIKILDNKLKQIELNTCLIEKTLRYLQNQAVN